MDLQILPGKSAEVRGRWAVCPADAQAEGLLGAGTGKVSAQAALLQSPRLRTLRLCAVEFSDLPVPQSICGASSGYTGVFSSRLFRRRHMHFYLKQQISCQDYVFVVGKMVAFRKPSKASTFPFENVAVCGTLVRDAFPLV